MPTPQKTDLKKTLRDHYTARPSPAVVDIADVQLLMVDGRGDPGSSPDYPTALRCLYGTAYAIKFREKTEGRDFVVPPLEGLWWADDMNAFLDGDRDSWEWTMMIAVPESVTSAVFDVVARSEEVHAPSEPPVRLERFEEGRSAQILHVGPYAEEEPTIRTLHEFIEEEGMARRGLHHEIYLSDPRRTAPDRLKTIIRQPVG